jgi:dGTPase
MSHQEFPLALHRFRLAFEENEDRFLSEHASRSNRSRGRVLPEPPDPLRTAFQRDRDRVLHSKAFRRLKHKTQVFIDPEEDHYRTRLTHTLEVSQIARTISRALRLNEDLTEAIALAHDLGHPPFGHGGERAIDEVLKEYVPDIEFRHYEQSLRVVDVLERDGKGLNLTYETRDGILGHSKGGADLGAPSALGKAPRTLEESVVKIADRIAYINHDIDDAIRAGLLSLADLPPDPIRVLGQRGSDRIAAMVMNVVLSSENQPAVNMTGDILLATNQLKDYMYANVYSRDLRGAREMSKAAGLLTDLFHCFMDQNEMLPSSLLAGESPDQFAQLSISDRALRVTDFIAGMTDRYAVRIFRQRFFPKAWGGI